MPNRRPKFEILETRWALDATAPLFLYRWTVEGKEYNAPVENWAYVNSGEGPVLNIDSGRHELGSRFRSAFWDADIGAQEGYAQVSVRAVETGTSTELFFSGEHHRSFSTGDLYPIYRSIDEVSAYVEVYSRAASRTARTTSSSTSSFEADQVFLQGQLYDYPPISLPRNSFTFPMGEDSQAAGPGYVALGYCNPIVYEGATYQCAGRYDFNIRSNMLDTSGKTAAFSNSAVASAQVKIEPLCQNGVYDQDSCQVPFIEEVIVEPGFAGQMPTDNNGNPSVSDGVTLVHAPTVLEPLRLKATVADTYSSPRYEIAGVRWLAYLDRATSAAAPNNFSQWYFTPANKKTRNSNGMLEFEHLMLPQSNQHGEHKFVTAILEFRDTWLNRSMQHFEDSDPFVLHFKKFSDDDDDGVANWFQYWSQDEDGATSHSKHYSAQDGISYRYGGNGLTGPGLPGPFYGTTETTFFGDITIALYDPSAGSGDPKWLLHENNPAPLKALYPGIVSGIDYVEATIMHEKAHMYLNSLKGKYDDTDEDGVPDFLEMAYARYGLDVNNENGLGYITADNGIKSPVVPYDGKGDEELFCELAWLGAIKEVNAFSPVGTQDFANPGRRTSPSFKRIATETGKLASLGENIHTNTYDSNLDGLYDVFTVSIPANVEDLGTYTFLATLEDSNGNVQHSARTVELAPGNRIVELYYDAGAIRRRRVDGPLKISNVMLLTSSSEVALDRVIETQPYTSSDFGLPTRATISELPRILSDPSRVATNFEVEISVQAVSLDISDARLSAALYSKDGQYLGEAWKTQQISHGNLPFILNFSREQLRFARVEDGLELRNVRLVDDAGEVVDYLEKLDLPGVFNNDSFGDSSVRIGSIESDSTVMSDSETGKMLRTSVKVDVSEAGKYAIQARLYSQLGRFIAGAETTRNLEVGLQKIDLDFPMQLIVANRLDGPFVLRAIQVLNQNGVLVDLSPVGEVTSAYMWGEFSSDVDLPASSTGSHESMSLSPQFDVTWAGDDGADGTGVRSYDVYVSENGGAYTHWIENSEATTAIFSGSYGRQYSFYSVATDNARNRELTPVEPDVIVRVVSPGQNIRSIEDVNDDGRVEPLDALLVINFISRNRQAASPSISVTDLSFEGRWVDVNGDGFVAPLDALRVINFISRSRRLSLSGESQRADRIFSPLISNSSDTVFAQLGWASDEDDLETQGSPVLF